MCPRRRRFYRIYDRRSAAEQRMCGMSTAQTNAGASPFGPVDVPRRSVLADEIYELLKSKLMDNVVEPGARLSIDALSRDLMVATLARFRPNAQLYRPYSTVRSTDKTVRERERLSEAVTRRHEAGAARAMSAYRSASRARLAGALG